MICHLGCVLLEICVFAPPRKYDTYISSLTSNIYYDVWKLVSRTLTLVRQIYDWRMIMISMAFDVNYLTTWFVVSCFVTVLSIWLCPVFDYGGKGLTYWIYVRRINFNGYTTCSNILTIRRCLRCRQHGRKFAAKIQEALPKSE